MNHRILYPFLVTIILSWNTRAEFEHPCHDADRKECLDRILHQEETKLEEKLQLLFRQIAEQEILPVAEEMNEHLIAAQQSWAKF